MGVTSVLAKAGSRSILTFGLSFKAVGSAIAGFTMQLGVLALGLGKILIVVGLIAGAVYLLGKAFGIGFKFPTMPDIKLPKYGKASTPETGEAEQAELKQATAADKKAAKEKEKELSKELKDKRKARDKEIKITK